MKEQKKKLYVGVVQERRRKYYNTNLELLHLFMVCIRHYETNRPNSEYEGSSWYRQAKDTGKNFYSSNDEQMRTFSAKIPFERIFPKNIYRR
ncbi:hypothetical protein CEXT_355681 [Caerostris extrusa]|uniref:Uncharacterized protein n=1 Tax=Caerostris extrusa TaxID=172846 RepID=A0AAV4U7U3_CAEEX|nr:hypothetical protein CEXT_355681 [Caerostris extrusa]